MNVVQVFTFVVWTQWYVIEIDSRVEPIRLKLVFDADERQINVVLLEILNEDNINRFEDI